MLRNLNPKGWNSQVCRGFPGMFESSNVSRRNVSSRIGRVYWIVVSFTKSKRHLGQHMFSGFHRAAFQKHIMRPTL